jgi:hypothetical protein
VEEGDKSGSGSMFSLTGDVLVGVSSKSSKSTYDDGDDYGDDDNNDDK